MHPSRASGTSCEAVSGHAQFPVRTREAILRVTHGGLRIGAECSTGEHWADCGLHFGPLAMSRS
eukprot:12375264-Alexandrium_andersonii.AAC.1